jgi:hypothetical protein
MAGETIEPTQEQLTLPRTNRVATQGAPFGIQSDVVVHPHTRIIIDLPPEAAKQLDELRQKTGDSHSDLFRKALTLYKLAREAVEAGKSVGVAETPDSLETRFVGL